MTIRCMGLDLGEYVEVKMTWWPVVHGDLQAVVRNATMVLVQALVVGTVCGRKTNV